MNGSSGNEELFVYHSPPSANLPPRSPSPNKVLHNNFLVSPPPKSAGKQRIKSRPPSGNSQKSRPPSGSTQKATQDNSSIGAYVKLKNAGLLNKPNSAEMRYLLDRGMCVLPYFSNVLKIPNNLYTNTLMHIGLLYRSKCP